MQNPIGTKKHYKTEACLTLELTTTHSKQNQTSKTEIKKHTSQQQDMGLPWEMASFFWLSEEFSMFIRN